MPYLIVLGVIVALITAAIFKVNKMQADRYVRLAQEAKVADDAEDDEGSGADEKNLNNDA